MPEPAQQRGSGGKGINMDMIAFAMMFIFVVGGVLRAVLGRFAGAGVSGAIAFFGAWLLMSSLIAGIVVAVIAFLITMVGGGGRGGLGGMGMGGGFGGGGFGGGGGGGFGGGGSSGSW